VINSTKRTITLTSTYTAQKHHDIRVGNPGPDLGQAHKCVGVKLVNGIPTLPSWLLDHQLVSKLYLKKTSTDSLQTTYYHKNDWHKHEQYNSRVNECS